MSTPAAFSRLQLAAALLEYDNDPDDPHAPYRSAQDSAIFAHLRVNPAARPGAAQRRSDLLDVSFPSETGSVGGRQSALGTNRSRHSRGSTVDALRNPFNGDIGSEFEVNDENRDENGEVDLASWGLDAFMPKGKGSKSSKTKGKQAVPPIESTLAHQPAAEQVTHLALPLRGRVTSKSISVGGIHEYFEEDGIEAAKLQARRRSFASPPDLAGMEPSGVPLVHQSATPRTSLDPSHMVPFPTSSIRSPSPGIDQSYEGPAGGVLHERTFSMGSVGSRAILDEGVGNVSPRTRQLSVGSMGLLDGEENPFAIDNPSHTSRFDPKNTNRNRRYSNASMGTILQNDNASTFTGGRPLSTVELLRPKVLVMPSPLQMVSKTPQVDPVPRVQVRDGFQLSTGGPPLPPGARTSRRMSSSFDVPLPSNSFTPNPIGDLSLSQKIFRNTLVVSGNQGAYSETLPRATHDGEQALLEPKETEEVPQQTPSDGPSKPSRPAGKLYGKSLIDDLEVRKSQMRSKQRVFTGDDRPSMMDRDRTSTLIDPATLKDRPPNVRSSSYGTSNGLSRQNSLNVKPLLTFDDEEVGKPSGRPGVGNRMASSRSVFGVDTLWEREMAKLKEIEAEEKEHNERRKKAEEEEERKKEDKKRKKKKGKDKADEKPLQVPTDLIPLESRVSIDPPILPNIERAIHRPPPKPSESDDDESDSDGEEPAPNVKQHAPSWHAGSSDEEDGRPRRTTGVGPRFPKSTTTNKHRASESDSDEDVPLASTIHKVLARSAFGGGSMEQDSDDEDKPLSHVLHRQRRKSDATSFHHLSPQARQATRRQQGSDEDDQPLGLRMSRAPTQSFLGHGQGGGDDEDDQPLAFHPEQQRRTQYQMFAHQQHQQQQMMAAQAAQMQSNMFMAQSMMSPAAQPMMSPAGYFMNPMMNVNPMAMMQVPPMPIPSPPPIPDEAKFGLVDRWRRDVASN